MSASGDPAGNGPYEQEPLEELFGNVFDLADRVASRISSAEIEERLRRTLQEEGNRSGSATSAASHSGEDLLGQPQGYTRLAYIRDMECPDIVGSIRGM